jgi:hypothetical protein
MASFESRYPFTAIPNWIIKKQLETPGGWLTTSEMCVLIALQFLADSSGDVNGVQPSYGAICSCANVSKTTAVSCMSLLKEKGLIQKVTRLDADKQLISVYKLNLWEKVQDSAPSQSIPAASPLPSTRQSPTAAPVASSRKFVATKDVVPVKLQSIAEQICGFFNNHKGGAKTNTAFNGLIDNLIRIATAPGGGIEQVKNQLQEAIDRSLAGEKKWHSITYSNWEKFGKKPKAGGWGQLQGSGRPSAATLVSKFEGDEAAVLDL